MKGNTRNKKRFFIVAAIIMAALLVAAGAFAAQSILSAGDGRSGAGINPGGRLHDDFDGTNKDIYVENFSDRLEGGTPIYARVRLDEYIEADRSGSVVTLKDGAVRSDRSTWSRYIFGGANAPFDDYRKLSFGGSTVYMPTFKKDTDSLAAEVNGTMEGGGSGNPYGDYREYYKGETISADAVYDDTDAAQNELEIHYGKATLPSQVITMAEWQNTYNKEPGNFWVYDTDGWAYWAAPIEPGQATGLLLTQVDMKKTPGSKWYYGINAVGQFASRGDWGDPAAGTGFYKEGEEPTADAEELLTIVSGAENSIRLTGSPDYIQPGTAQQVTAELIVRGAESSDIAWSVSADSANTTIDGTGKLTIGSNEPLGNLITVRAASAEDRDLYVEKKIRVASAGYARLEEISPGELTTTTIDGKSWYVIDKKIRDGQKQALIWSKDYFTNRAFDSDSNRWNGSDMESYLNGAYIAGMPELNATAINTLIYNRTDYNSDAFEDTWDRVFLLSEADFFGKVNVRESYAKTAEARDYSNGEGTLQIPNDMVASASRAYYMTRSAAPPAAQGQEVWFVYADIRSGSPTNIWTSMGYVDSVTTYRCRGAMWVPLQ